MQASAGPYNSRTLKPTSPHSPAQPRKSAFCTPLLCENSGSPSNFFSELYFQGLGALLSPLAATTWITSGRSFSHFYGVSLALTGTSLSITCITFRFDSRRLIGNLPRLPQEPFRGDIVEQPLSSLQNMAEGQRSIYLLWCTWIFAGLYFLFVVRVLC